MPSSKALSNFPKLTPEFHSVLQELITKIRLGSRIKARMSERGIEVYLDHTATKIYINNGRTFVYNVIYESFFAPSLGELVLEKLERRLAFDDNRGIIHLLSTKENK